MTDDQFTKLSEQISKLDGGFLKLYRHMEERFDELEAKVDTKADRDQVDRLASTVDGIVGRLDTIETELAAHTHQQTRRAEETDKHLDRHDHHIKQLADHSQVKLEPQG